MAISRGMQPVLSGTKVLLRPWTPADADDVFAFCQDAEIQRRTMVPSPYEHSHAVGYVGEVAPAAWEAGGAVFAVVDAESGAPAGSIGAHGMTDAVAHVGYWTAPAARGRGLTSDALRTLTGWFLHGGGAERVELVVEPDNLASVRVAQAAGFTREGVLRRRYVVGGRRIDAVMYSMLAGDPAAAGL